MKIALVAQHATPAADQADNRVLELGRSLAGNGHQVTVYAGRHKSSLPEQADLMRGVAVEYIGPMDSADSRDDAELLAQVPAFARPLHERWSEDRPDVVHAVRWTSGLAALAAARDLRVPIVQSFDSLGVAERRHHRSAPLDAGVERMRLEPAIGRSANAVVAGSSDEESDLTRLGVPRRSIKVIPCGVDTDEFTPEGPAYKGNDRYRLVTVAGGLGELDALGTLLRAVAKVPNAELVIAGGPKREALHDDLSYRRLAKLADSLDLNGRVFFAGEVGRADLPPLLRSARLCVNVGEYEPSAMASIQSMACGTPVIASAVGGHIDAVVDGTTGILVPPGHPALLAQRIRQLLSHPMLLEAFSVAAVDRARSRYSLDRIAHETLAVYGKALDSAGMSAMTSMAA
jgi:glycosyltransferase involved in cell wall biosynthesis